MVLTKERLRQDNLVNSSTDLSPAGYYLLNTFHWFDLGLVLFTWLRAFVKTWKTSLLFSYVESLVYIYKIYIYERKLLT